MRSERMLRKGMLIVLTLIFGSMFIISISTTTAAWRDDTQIKTNIATGSGIGHRVTLIEDSKNVHGWTVGSPVTKDIKVLNSGLNEDNFGDVFVKLRVREYMEIAELLGYDKSLEGMFADSMSKDYYVSDNEDNLISEKDKDVLVSTIRAMKLEDDLTKLMIDNISNTKDLINSDDDNFMVKYDESMDLESARLNKRKILLEAIYKDPVPVIPGTERHDLEDLDHHADRNEECTYPIKDWYSENPIDEWVDVERGGSFITLDEWEKLEEKDKLDKWVIDVSARGEGWIYWTNKLPAGEYTGSLTTTEHLLKQPNGSFYYTMHTDLSSTSIDEIEVLDAPKSIESFYKVVAEKGL